MIKIEQVRLLEQRVQKVISRIGELERENSTLREKLQTYQDRIADLELRIEGFTSNQEEIEAGILSALQRLDEVEDVLGEEGLEQRHVDTEVDTEADAEAEAEAEAETTDSSPADNDDDDDDADAFRNKGNPDTVGAADGSDEGPLDEEPLGEEPLDEEPAEEHGEDDTDSGKQAGESGPELDIF